MTAELELACAALKVVLTGLFILLALVRWSSLLHRSSVYGSLPFSVTYERTLVSASAAQVVIDGLHLRALWQLRHIPGMSVVQRGWWAAAWCGPQHSRAGHAGRAVCCAPLAPVAVTLCTCLCGA